MEASPWAMLNRKKASGSFSVIRTVSGSTASTVSTDLKIALVGLTLSSAIARSKLNFTSEASKAEPSWKVTPSARSKVKTRPSSLMVQLSARSGTISPVSVTEVSDSKTLWVKIVSIDAVASTVGSSTVGSC